MSIPWRSLEALLAKHKDMVFSIALRITSNRESAEEVAQDVFLELHRNLSGKISGGKPNLQSEDHTLFWLRRVATHRAIDTARRSARIPEATEDVTLLASQNKLADPLLSQHLRQMVATLPENMKAVVVLRYQEDMMPEEISETLNMPVATVKSNLQRGLDILRRKTEKVLR